MKQFPIQSEYNYDCQQNLDGFSIPWAMIAPHEEQAKKNHCGQTLERLAQRAGLGACEALAVLEDREWKRIEPLVAHNTLKSLANKFRP